ncbi:MAG: NAD(P)/FAD-dependent oxidoreductase [Candidatus Sumerlaeia bacterium]
MAGQKDILIAGGGASGLLAAVVAARQGARVRVLERMSRVGKKILATGNGRCNLTNINHSLTRYHGANPDFIRGVIEQFDANRTIDFFVDLGLLPRLEEEGKVFPLSEQASSVLDLLRYEMDRFGVEEICDVRAQAVEQKDGRLALSTTDGQEFLADAIIVATGGKSAPNLGSNGGGFKLAKALGHTIIEPFPALVQVNLDAWFLKRLKGLKLQSAAEVMVDGEMRRSDQGELLFTDYGISGPPILQLSRVVSEFAPKGRDVRLVLDLYPEKEEADLVKMIQDRINRSPEKDMLFSFVGFLHKRLAPVLLSEAGIRDTKAPASALSSDAIEKLAHCMKRWELRCTGVQSWMNSQVTAGGVDATELNPQSLESKKMPGVYFAGEVIDVDGDCGGYNLQWAWSSGYVAAMHAAQ